MRDELDWRRQGASRIGGYWLAYAVVMCVCHRYSQGKTKVYEQSVEEVQSTYMSIPKQSLWKANGLRKRAFTLGTLCLQSKILCVNVKKKGCRVVTMRNLNRTSS